MARYRRPMMCIPLLAGLLLSGPLLIAAATPAAAQQPLPSIHARQPLPSVAADRTYQIELFHITRIPPPQLLTRTQDVDRFAGQVNRDRLIPLLEEIGGRRLDSDQRRRVIEADRRRTALERLRAMTETR